MLRELVARLQVNSNPLALFSRFIWFYFGVSKTAAILPDYCCLPLAARRLVTVRRSGDRWGSDEREEREGLVQQLESSWRRVAADVDDGLHLERTSPSISFTR